jgi:serine protease AprX
VHGRSASFGLKLVLLSLALSAAAAGQTTPLAAMSSDLLALLRAGSARPVRAIVRGDVEAIRASASRDRLTVGRVVDDFVVVIATPGQLNSLRSVPGILTISRDTIVAPAMAVSVRAMAADLARQADAGLVGLGLPAVTGSGIGIAVVDSGIAIHPALAQRVVAAVSFVAGDLSTDDAFGHGTHIAGIIAGSGLAAEGVTSLYRGGVAPGAHLVNVRVLGAAGVGYTSDVIAGIHWVVANRSRYAIRVMNLSLGHPVVESCVTDPLCLAVERAATSGLVVVASAGNNGKDVEGREVLSSITTPGNAPQAITVGALNTWATVSRDDDSVTSYSSRGPTSYDLLFKPDVVAPGNKILSLGVPGSSLYARFPAQRVGNGPNSYFVMSGTSMAAAMVSGGAALLLDGGPTLTARQVKLAIQVSASFLPEDGLLAAGTGSVNFYAARRVQGASQALLGSLPAVTVGGRTVRPGGLVVSESGSFVDQTSAGAGLRLYSAVEWLEAWMSPARLGGTVSVLGLGNPVASLGPARILWGGLADVVDDQQIIWSDGSHSGGQQIIWSDQWLNPEGQQIIWSDYSQTGGSQIIWSDSSPSEGQQIIWSDHTRTEGSQIIWSDSVREP